eukprot:5139580-Amphidinium_carterae.1
MNGVCIDNVIAAAETQQAMQNRHLQLGINSLALMEPANSEPIGYGAAVSSQFAQPFATPPRAGANPAFVFERVQNGDYFQDEEAEPSPQDAPSTPTSRAHLGSLG